MAVYTSPSETTLREFLAEYDIGDLVQFRGIAEGVENSNFLLVTSERAYVLTIYEKRVDPRDLPFFLGMTEWLAERGIPCPRPVHGRDGEVIRSLCGKPAAIVTFLEGASPRVIRNEHATLLGEMQARVHLAGQDFAASRTNTLSLAGWRTLFAKVGGDAERIAPGLGAMLGEELAFLEAHWPHDLPRGVIHGDLFPDNVFFLGNAPREIRLSGIIDFYFACSDLLAYDLAICLNCWCFESNHEFNVTRARLLLRSYNQVRPISQAELEAMPTLCRGAALRFLLTRAHDWLFPVEGALVRAKDPLEYVKKLRFHQRVKHHGEYAL